MHKESLKNTLNPIDLFNTVKFKTDEYRQHPNWMRTFGSCIFCGAQGQGKTLSAVQYVLKLSKEFPCAIIVSNVAMKNRPFNAYLDDNHVIRLLDNDEKVTSDYILAHASSKGFSPICLEYTGLDMLKYVNNDEYGVIYLIDELHLELNSLESKNIDIDIMVEISQQRKQRKHIVGTSQIYLRLAKPLREQIHDIVLCRCFFGCIQLNKWIAGDTVIEKNGKIEAEVRGRFLFFHSPDMYLEYDTYAKMKRYNQEWNGRKRTDNLYEQGGMPVYDKSRHRLR